MKLESKIKIVCLIGSIFFAIAIIIKFHYFKTLTLPDGYKIVRSFGSEKYISPANKILYKSKNKTEFILQNEWISIASLPNDSSFDERIVLIKKFSDEVLILSASDTRYKNIVNDNDLISVPNVSALNLDFYFDGIISSPEWIQESNGVFRK